MTNDTRQALAILAFILLGPTMLISAPKDLVAECHEVKEEQEMLEDE